VDLTRAPNHSRPIPARLPSVAFDRLEHLVSAVADQQLRVVVRFAGHVDAARLARAVRLSLDAEPVLGCRWVERRWRPYWERLPDLDSRDLCPLEHSPDPEAALLRWLVTPLDLPAGPQAHARLFRGADDWLCVQMNHAVVDGGGLIEYVVLLASLYRKLGAERDHRPRPNLRGARGQGQVFRRIPLLGLLASLKGAGVPDQAWGFPAEGRDLSGRTTLIRRISPAEVEGLRAYARSKGVSFNTVLLAAFHRAYARVVGAPQDVPLPVQVPVNLRRYLPGGRAGALCNLAGSMYPEMFYKPDIPSEANVAQADAAQKAAAGRVPGIGQALMLEAAMALPYAFAGRMAASAMSGPQTGKTNPFLSNMGVIDPGWVDFGEVAVMDAYGVGPVLYPPGFLLAASTFRGTLTLATSFCQTAMDARLVARCLEGTVEELLLLLTHNP
jgi:NRPS condensation-like uncharacterized protein